MARVWFVVLVLIQLVYANEYGNCDECLRKGGTWCKEFGSDHCSMTTNDDWCPDNREKSPPTGSNVKGQQNTVKERRLYVNLPGRLEIPYNSPTERKVNVSIVDSSQSKDIDVYVYHTKCDGTQCIATIEATPSMDFCSSNGGVFEYAYAKVSIENMQDVTIKYHIACACMCSKDVVVNSTACSGRGNLSCGMCTCPNSWSGNECEIKTCPEKRGDVPCTNSASNVECSGNGYCGECDTCVCYTDREGSQYFDEDNCSDLCMIVNTYDTCLVNTTLGKCPENNFMEKIAYNESLTHIVDNRQRRVWVKCNETVNGCYVQYWAMRDETDVISIMVETSCNHVEMAYASSGRKVSWILGILGILAVVGTVCGVLLWKHFNSVPPLPLSDPEYQNIDAEDCTGENPLYKSPMSSFKNPTYGKW